MEWLVGDLWRKARDGIFLILIASMLVGLFANTFITTTASAQGANPTDPPTAQQADPDEEEEEESEGEGGVSRSANSGCNLPSIGWWVCGPISLIGDGMDFIYNQLSEFMKIRPLEVSNQSSGFYKAWDIMRTFANAVFIVALLVIVYSQISSVGISNYGIKRMTPRLIIAAILVNLSYIICAILIDLSNIGGIAVKGLFDTIAQEALSGEANYSEIFSFSSITQAFLTGGSLAVAGFFAVEGSLTAAAPLFIPILAMLFLSLLVALLVLAARQALLIVLTVISPIAFVLYLLPGTEKWFDKWKDLMLIMIIFFPAFSVVFGGANLAGILIITNASSIVIFILGFAVMLAPLAITPFIMKLSGGLLNRFAGIVNDPTKGMVDRSRQWAKDKSKVMAGNSRRRMEKREMAAQNKPGKDGKPKGRKWYHSVNPYGAGRRVARYMDTNSRLLKDQVADTDKALENSYHQTQKYKRHDLKSRHTDERSELIAQRSANRYSEMRAGHMPADIIPSFRDNIRTGASRLSGGRISGTGSVEAQADEIRVTFEDIAAEGMRKQNNERVFNQQIADVMLKNEEIRKRAAGIYEFGEDAARASAIATIRSDYAKNVEEGTQIVKHFNLSSEQRQAHAMGTREFTINKDGASYTFSNDGKFTRENAIEEQIVNGTVLEVEQIISRSGSDLKEFQTTIAAAMAKSGVKSKAPYMGGKLIDDVGRGEIKSRADLQNYIVEWVKGGKFKPVDISSMDKDGLGLLMDSIGGVGSAARNHIGTDRLKGLSSQIDQILTIPELHANMADNAEGMFRGLRYTLPDPDTPTPPSRPAGGA